MLFNAASVRVMVWVGVVLVISCVLLTGRDSDKAQNSSKHQSEPVLHDPQAFTESQTQAVVLSLNNLKIGELLVCETHPTGKFEQASVPSVSCSADRRMIVAKISTYWRGTYGKGLKLKHETHFAIEITKKRLRLVVERDEANFHINPKNRDMAEWKIAQQVLPLFD